jgi:hypothetical protein
MATQKRSTTYRLTDEARALQIVLAAKLGLSLSATLELAIRKLAQAEGVTVPQTLRPNKRAAKV